LGFTIDFPFATHLKTYSSVAATRRQSLIQPFPTATNPNSAAHIRNLQTIQPLKGKSNPKQSFPSAIATLLLLSHNKYYSITQNQKTIASKGKNFNSAHSSNPNNFTLNPRIMVLKNNLQSKKFRKESFFDLESKSCQIISSNFYLCKVYLMV
jgi:hypothetical protein